VVSEPLLRGAAPTGRNRRYRCCRVAARSWLRPPTADCARRERSLRSYSSAPAATTGWSRRQMPQRPIRRGSSERHGSLGGKSPRGIGSGRVPASPCLGVLRRRSAAEARPVAAQVRHCPLS